MNETKPEYLSIPDVAEMLEITPSQVRRLIEERHLSAKRIDNVLQIPALFLMNSETVSGLRGTLILLEDSGFSNDEAIDWVLSESEELGGTPIDELRKGHKAPVRRAIQMLA
ncbi:Rv2175c family DNA-binding protein [Leucobacter chinensis]|uniref:Rv2175c family DNA-binding protein n=1 Tax=Leucobacter chinensis TaxID=2851010 RepID=UPI00350F5C6B